ncbi:MAG: carbohydrate ABC transporter substrate-binding protein [Chloroflexi bacterium]|nr:carbohydrate ABC transporter substrate-binding protein [Chloroflexota bacterium]
MSLAASYWVAHHRLARPLGASGYMMLKSLLAILLLIALLSTSAAQESVTLRFLCFQDRNECDVYADLLARFSEDNPGITVAVDVTAEEEVFERELAAYDAGEPYDILRMNGSWWLTGGYVNLRPLIGETLMRTFRSAYFELLRHHPANTGIYAFPDALDMVAPFVNVSLFEQAGVALPDDGASWDEWLAALDEVVAATDAAYVLSVDNNDHRLVGPAMSLGAQYFDADGKFTLPDSDGLRDILTILHGLMEAGKTPADTLLGTGKSQEYFVRGETVMYICGSWKVEEVAAQVGADFDWAIVPNPSGPGGATGVALATWLVADIGTDQPEAVAKVFEYLLEAEVSAEFAARTLTVPAREDLAAAGIDYQTDDEVVAAALNGFAREVPNLQDQAILFDVIGERFFYYAKSNEFLRAYFAGELSLDVALARLQARLEEIKNG